MTKFEHEGNIMSLEHCSLFLSILGLQTLLHTHRQAQKLAHCVCLGLFSHFRAEKVAGTPAVEPPKHWHGITWTIKKRSERDSPGKILYTGGIINGNGNEGLSYRI